MAASGKVLCCGAKVGMTFMDAAPEVQLLVLLLFGVALATIVLWVRGARRIRKGQDVTRTLAFLEGWRTAAPLLALAGVSYQFVNFFVAVYAYPPVASYQEYAPGFAEGALVLWPGFLAGGLAALALSGLRGRQAAQAVH